MHRELVLIEGGRVTRWAPPDPVTAIHLRSLAEDSRGRILVASAQQPFEYVPQPGGGARGDWKRLPLSLAPRQSIHQIWAARDGVLWIGTTAGLIQYVSGEQVQHTTANGLPNDFIWTMRDDRDGNLWVGTNNGPARLPAEHTTSWTRTDGRIWFTTQRGLLRCGAPGSRSPAFVFLPFAGLAETDEATDLLSDRSGKVWFRTQSDVARVVEGRIERVLPNEWRPAPIPRRLFLDFKGRLWAPRCRAGRPGTAGHVGHRGHPPAQGASSGPRPAGAHRPRRRRADLPCAVRRSLLSFHLQKIYEKLQVHSKSHAVAKALRDRLVR